MNTSYLRNILFQQINSQIHRVSLQHSTICGFHRFDSRFRQFLTLIIQISRINKKAKYTFNAPQSPETPGILTITCNILQILYLFCDFVTRCVSLSINIKLCDSGYYAAIRLLVKIEIRIPAHNAFSCFKYSKKTQVLIYKA